MEGSLVELQGLASSFADVTMQSSAWSSYYAEVHQHYLVPGDIQR